MAASLASAEVEKLDKSVQELFLTSENLPKNYVYEEGGAGFRDALLPSDSDAEDSIPVVDLHHLTSPSTAQPQELAKLHHALNSWGCFQAINHGMTSSFLDKVRDISKQFFELPKEEKQKYAREPNDIEGYGKDVIFSENQRLDWTDRVYLKVQPEDQRKFKVWPQKPNDFRSIVLQYTESLRLLAEAGACEFVHTYTFVAAAFAIDIANAIAINFTLSVLFCSFSFFFLLAKAHSDVHNMGKKLDALLGRTFKASKFKPTVSLAISRLAVLKNQRQARLRQARSDVLELLQLGHHERALLRVEHVIKDQNMLDVYDKIEGYCNLLIERVHLIEQERECPGELQEAASGLLYAASRCGEFPEIQEIRAVLTSRFGKEFASRAIELRNNCGVHPQMIQKLSTRMPSLESRMKVLKEIAYENGIALQLEEASSVSVEEQSNVEKQNQHEPEKKEENIGILPNRGKDEELTDSFKARQKYKDVAGAAQAAFESAAYAAVAARAALELSRSEPHDPDDHNSPSFKARKVLDGHDSVKSQPEGKEILSETKGEKFNNDIDELKKPKDILSCNSDDEVFKGAAASVDAEIEGDLFEKELVFDESGDETDNKQNGNQSAKQISSRYDAGIEVGSGSRQLVLNTVSGSKMQSAPQINLEKRPISVRTR